MKLETALYHDIV